MDKVTEAPITVTVTDDLGNVITVQVNPKTAVTSPVGDSPVGWKVESNREFTPDEY